MDLTTRNSHHVCVPVKFVTRIIALRIMSQNVQRAVCAKLQYLVNCRPGTYPPTGQGVTNLPPPPPDSDLVNSLEQLLSPSGNIKSTSSERNPVELVLKGNTGDNNLTR